MSSKAKQVGEIPALTSYLSTQLKAELRANIRLVICLSWSTNHNQRRLSWDKYMLLFVPLYLNTYPARRYFLEHKPSASMICTFIDNHLSYQYGIEGPISAQLKKSEEILEKVCAFAYASFSL